MLNKFIIFLTIICFCSTTLYASDLDQEYANAIESYEKLKEDKNKRTYRHNWIELSDKFWQLYQKNQKWKNSVSALYKSAEALEFMSNYSFVDRDAHDSSVRYEQLAKNHPNNNLADDALYAAANLRYTHLKDQAYALKLLDLLDKNYKNGDMIKQSQALRIKISNIVQKENNSPEKTTKHIVENNKKVEDTKPVVQNIEAPKTKDTTETTTSSDQKATNQETKVTNTSNTKVEDKNTPKPEVSKDTSKNTNKETSKKASNSKPVLEKITWDLNSPISKVNIILDQFSDWNVLYIPAKGKTPDRLIIELLGVEATKRPAGGYVAKGDYAMRQAITRVAVDYGTPNKTRIIVDCPKLKRYDINLTGFPYRLTLEVSKNAKDLAQGYTPGQGKPKNDLSKLDELKKLPMDVLAEQLSLQIQSVVLDAGHGGKDPGAMNNGLTEKNLSLELVKLIAKKLEQNKIKVYFTRKDDTFLKLSERAKIANDYKADIFVSIHVNANDNPLVHGFESYYLDIANSSESAMLALKENNNERSQGQMNEVLEDLMIGLRTYESRNLAQRIHTKTLAKTKANKYSTQDGKLKGAPFYVLMGISMPGVLIETGYSTNQAEVKLLKNQKYKDTLAQGITDGIMAYIKEHNKTK